MEATIFIKNFWFHIGLEKFTSTFLKEKSETVTSEAGAVGGAGAVVKLKTSGVPLAITVGTAREKVKKALFPNESIPAKEFQGKVLIFVNYIAFEKVMFCQCLYSTVMLTYLF